MSLLGDHIADFLSEFDQDARDVVLEQVARKFGCPEIEGIVTDHTAEHESGSTLRRTIVAYEVLWDSAGSEHASSDVFEDAATLAYQISEGDASGRSWTVSDETVTRADMAALLVAQGSDPAFLSCDDEDEEDGEG